MPGRVILLASQSQGRASLLHQSHLPFATKSTSVTEDKPAGQVSQADAEQLVLTNSNRKLKSCLGQLTKEDWAKYNVVIAADTLIWLPNQVVGKPASKEEANRFLQLLGGRKHHCISGATCVVVQKGQSEPYSPPFEIVDTTSVILTADKSLIRAYLESGEWEGRAGAYAIQGLGGSLLVEEMQGNYDTVVGLPLQKILKHLSRHYSSVILELLNHCNL